MFPFCDVPAAEVRATARSYSRLEALIGETPTAQETARFFLLARMLDVVEATDEVAFCSRHIFYDLSGSTARLSVGAALLRPFGECVSIEPSAHKHGLAEALVAEAARELRRAASGPAPQPTELSVRRTSFLKFDWVDADVALFDCTVYDYIDEGVVCQVLEQKLRKVVCGSYLVLLTRWDKQLVGRDHLVLVAKDVRDDGGAYPLWCWLFRTSSTSVDHRTR